MHQVLTGFSRALYSNWLWHRPLQLLVDAGEGVHLALRTEVFSPSIVALTHGHSDHVLGLAGFAGARRFGKGATSKPWTVLYPAGSLGVTAMRELIGQIWRGIEFPIAWTAVRAGDRHAMSQHRAIEAFAVRHVADPESALGYRVLESRRRLKPEYSRLPELEIERLARINGRDHLTEQYHHVLFMHSGDAMPVDVELARKADLLVHDATFLRSDDRRDPIHATTEEVLIIAREASVSTLVINHLSVRYDRAAALPVMRQQLAASGFGGECWLLDESEFINLR